MADGSSSRAVFGWCAEGEVSSLVRRGPAWARLRLSVVVSALAVVLAAPVTAPVAASNAARTVGAAVVVSGTARDSGGWWDGTASLAGAPVSIVEQGRCGSGGSGVLASLLAGALDVMCSRPEGPAAGVGGAAALGSSGGVGWFEGSGGHGSYVEFALAGAAALPSGLYRGLGVVDFVFAGGTLAADFRDCHFEVRGQSSLCVAAVVGAFLPPGAFIGASIAPAAAPAAAADGLPDAPMIERAALMALYDSTGGDGWSRRENWNTSTPVRYWYGVTVDAVGSVESLYLHNNNLTGAIPPQIEHLKGLKTVDLSANALTGAIPAQIGALGRLSDLNLSHNSLTGAIPAQIGALGRLSDLNLSHNSLTGIIPPHIGALSRLALLNLSHNSLTGAIPAQIGSLGRLTSLDLAHNNLSGAIPVQMSGLANLVYLSTFGNNFDGAGWRDAAGGEDGAAGSQSPPGRGLGLSGRQHGQRGGRGREPRQRQRLRRRRRRRPRPQDAVIRSWRERDPRPRRQRPHPRRRRAPKHHPHRADSGTAPAGVRLLTWLPDRQLDGELHQPEPR